MRQFQAEPEPQPGCTQPYFSQTQANRNQSDHDTSMGPLPHAPVGKVKSLSLTRTLNKKWTLTLHLDF